MNMLIMFMVLMVGAILTMPIWSYSANWKLAPCGACLGLAMLGAILVVVGII
jgi:hypothetical protein